MSKKSCIREIVSLGVAFFDDAAKHQLSALVNMRTGIEKMNKELETYHHKNVLLQKEVDTLKRVVSRMRRKLHQHEVINGSISVEQIQIEATEQYDDQEYTSLHEQGESSNETIDSISDNAVTLKSDVRHRKQSKERKCVDAVMKAIFVEDQGQMSQLGTRVENSSDEEVSDVNFATNGNEMEMDNSCSGISSQTMPILKHMNSALPNSEQNYPQPPCQDVQPMETYIDGQSMETCNIPHQESCVDNNISTNCSPDEEFCPSSSSLNKRRQDVEQEDYQSSKDDGKEGSSAGHNQPSKPVAYPNQSNKCSLSQGEERKQLDTAENDKGSISKQMLKSPYGTRKSNRISARKCLTCQVCPRSFPEKLHLPLHMVSHSRTLPCPFCSKTFSTKGYLSIHIRSHTGERLFQCTLCTKAYTSRSNLTVHMRVHSGEKPFQCNSCSMSFSSKSSCKSHKRSHSKRKKFRCQFCSNMFSCQRSLTMHMRVHSAETPLKCIVCSMSFTQSSALAVHMRTHSTQKPFKCFICMKSYWDPYYFVKHMCTKPVDKPFKCELCNKSFSRKCHLCRHMLVHSQKGANKM